MKEDQVWQTTLGQLQLQMTRATFDTWLKDTRIVELTDNQKRGNLIIAELTNSENVLNNGLPSQPLYRRVLNNIGLNQFLLQCNKTTK